MSQAKYHIRFYDILKPTQTNIPVTVVGAGAIGSPVVICLAKMGFEDITVFDHDEVSEENIGVQWYGPGDIGTYKVATLAERCEELTGIKPIIAPRLFNVDEDIATYPQIVITAVDNMQLRKQVGEQYAKNPSFHLIDPRMGAEQGIIYHVPIGDLDRYRKSYEPTLHSDAQGLQERCTAKATMYSAMMIAGHVCKIVKDIAVGEATPKNVQWNIRNNDYEAFMPTTKGDE